MMYPTGYADASQGIDFSKSSQNLQNSSLQLQAEQAKERMSELSESQKYILKSADMATVPEVSGNLRNMFDQHIQDLRQKTINLVRQRNGVLTTSDKAQIEQSAIGLQNGMTRAKLGLAELQKQQMELTKPGMDQVINMPAAREELGKLATRLQNGEDVGSDIASLPMRHAIIPSEEQLFAKQIAPQMQRWGTTETLSTKGGKDTKTTTTNIPQATHDTQQLLIGNSMWWPKIAQKDASGNVMMSEGKPVIDPAKLEAATNQMLSATVKTSVSEAHAPRPKGLGTQNPLLDLTWESGKIGNQDYSSLTTLPSPTKTTANVVSARNEDTGAEEKPGGSYEITPTHIGITPKGEGRIVYSAPGAPKMIDGKQVYSSDGNDRGALTADEAKTGQKSAAKKLLPDKGNGWDIVGDPEVKESPNGLTLVYKAEKLPSITEGTGSWAKGKLPWTDKAKPIAEQTVEVKLKPVIDDKANGMRSMPINKANINLIPQATLNRKTQNDKGQTVKLIDYLQDLMSRPKGQESATPAGSNSNMGNDAVIQDAVKKFPNAHVR